MLCLLSVDGSGSVSFVQKKYNEGLFPETVFGLWLEESASIALFLQPRLTC